MDIVKGSKSHAEKTASSLGRVLLALPKAVAKGASLIWRFVVAIVTSVAVALSDVGKAMLYGDWATRVSFVIMGFYGFVRRQIGRGICFLAVQVGYILYMLFFGAGYLAKFTTLGTQTQDRVFDEATGIYVYTAGDNSMEILLFGTVTIVLTVIFAILWVASVRAAYRTCLMRRNGTKLPTTSQDLRELLGKNYHATLLTLPSLLVGVFTLLPLIFMVLMAFTNYDKAHQPPGNLFTWVGLENFKDIFGSNPKISYTFLHLLGWTLVWALFATFTNYILGMILALLINKKGIRFKKMWRLIFIITIAVPQFVTLMLMSQLLHDQGALNVLLKSIGLTSEPIGFLSNATLARISVIAVNMWIGIPYSMLITSGILLNIPEDLYEAARIDGATPVQTFFKITLPYMLFVTTPYLITQFVGNINNFNVIYLLTGGGPLTLDYYQAGKTDLLVTWLYKQTVQEQNYNLAAVIGIVVFVITALMSIIVYNNSAAVKKEEQFS